MSTMPKPPWKPKTPAQTEAWAELRRLAKKAKDSDSALWLAIAAARDLDIPDLALGKLPGVSRATLNRRLGSRSEPKQQPPP